MKSPDNSKIDPRKTSIWLGFATRERTSRGTIRIRIRWGKGLLFALVLSMLLWMGKSLALYYFFKEVRHFEDVPFMEMVVFPLNRQSVRLQQGNYQIEQGRQALEREDYRRAYDLLREGLARSPDNAGGRKELARIYQGWRPDLATELLVDGLEAGKSDPEYIRLMFALLLSQSEDKMVLDISEDLLTQPLGENTLNIVRTARLQSAMLRGHFDIAKKIFKESNVKNTWDGILLGTQLYMRSGRDEAARSILEEILRSKPKGNLSPVYMQLIRMYMDVGMGEKARETALDFGIHDPMGWNPRIMLIDTLNFNGMTTRRDMEINAFLLQNRKDEEAMTTLAQLCAEHGNVEGATRLYEIALENGFNLGTFTLLLVEASVRNDQPEVAIGLCNELAREDPAWMVPLKGTFNAIRSLAYYQAGNEELGNLYLRDLLDSAEPGESVLYQTARTMKEFGFNEQAMRILTKALILNPNNEHVLASLIDVEMKLGAYFSIADHLRTLFTLRRPGYDLIEDFKARLQSDRFLFTNDRPELLEALSAIIAEQDDMDWDIWTRHSEGKS